MKRVVASAIGILMLATGLRAQSAPDAAELTSLLKEFLAGASRNDAAVHERFWAEDLIYTGSSGRRIGKPDIVRGQRSTPASNAPVVTTVYSAEDIRIQQYGNTAVVAFRLVGSTTREGKSYATNYLNTGTFVKRDGKWQAVSWQATKMPRQEEDAKREVAAIETAFHKAILVADIKKLEALADDSFIWTHRDGEQMTRKQLLAELGSGQLKYSKLETNKVTVTVYGDSAVVRGVSSRQRSSIPGSHTGDAGPFTLFYTLTLINKGGAWNAVAMHSSRP